VIDEKWAVLVNEFGALGIDGAILEAAAGERDVANAEGPSGALPPEGVTIKQLAGGCMCCVAAGMLAPAIAMVSLQAMKDQLHRYLR
jgi:G3E family GTPase